MPEAAKGPRLWLRRERRDKSGAVTHKAMWFIRDDGRYQQSTGCGIDDRERAVQLLADYMAQKRLDGARGARDPASVPVAYVIARCDRDRAAKCARPKEAAQRARALLAYFGDKTLRISMAIAAGATQSSVRPMQPRGANWRTYAPRLIIIAA